MGCTSPARPEGTRYTERKPQMPEPESEIAPLPATLIRRLNQISVARFAAAMSAARLDLTPVQYAALAALATNPGVDQATLAALIGYDRATLGKVVERLEAKSLLHREIRPEDRRARSLHLTRTGESLCASARPHVEGIQPEILAGLSTAEREELVRLLVKATRMAEHGDHDAPPMMRIA